MRFPCVPVRVGVEGVVGLYKYISGKLLERSDGSRGVSLMLYTAVYTGVWYADDARDPVYEYIAWLGFD